MTEFWKDKQKSVVKDNSLNNDYGDKYSNLNLIQNYKYSNIFPVQSYSTSNSDKYCDSTASEDFEEKKKSKSWNKSSEFPHFSLFNDESKGEKNGLKKDSNNNSTLSLHISAYENSNKYDLFNGKNNDGFKSETIKKWEDTKQISFASTFNHQNSFEFPRQQNDRFTEPEMSQFRASYQLFHPPGIPNAASNKDRPAASMQKPKSLSSKDVKIHDVWKHNLEKEFERIREIIHEYSYIAFDTEFPGVVATPVGAFQSKEEFQYNQISCNVNMLKVIQVGFCLTNSKGELPPDGDIWQFNFEFSMDDDMYAVESVDLLRRSGIDFDRHRTDGISVEDFGALLTTSGLVVNKNVTWLTFHSCFDFGYLIKSIIGLNLPISEKTFFEYHKILFPQSYDIKMLMKIPKIQAAKLRGGLQDIADQLSVKRIGYQHQAGSDSLLTARTFFKLREKFFNSNWAELEAQFQGYMFGLGASFTQTSNDLPVPITKFNSHPLQSNDDGMSFPINYAPPPINAPTYSSAAATPQRPPFNMFSFVHPPY